MGLATVPRGWTADGRRPGRSAAVLGLLVAILGSLASACTTRRASHSEGGERLAWSECGDIECAQLEVPLDHDRPGGRTITLALGRLPATGVPQGVLLVNPGGPGASGRDVSWAADAMPPDVRRSFDIVGWDPRGVGASGALVCAQRLDRLFSLALPPRSPQDLARAERVSRALAAECGRSDRELLAHMATADSVADIEAIRQALDKPRISFLGYSYGSVLGLGYLARHPLRLESLVLDGPVDITRSAATLAIDQGAGFDRSLQLFFDWCDRTEDCGFGGGDAAAAFDRLAALVEQESLPGTVDGEERELGPGLFALGVVEPLYSGEWGFEDLAAALAAAARGDGGPLIELSDDYTGRRPGGRYDGTMGAFYATSCTDPPPLGDVADIRRLSVRVGRAAPRLGASGLWLGLPCVYWPVQPEGSATSALPQPLGELRVLVVGATADPATPYVWARGVASGFGPRAALVTRVGDGHVSFAMGDRCVDAAVAAYLTEGVMPDGERRCG